MEGFTGFKTVATPRMPKTTTMVAPFHIIRLVGDAPDVCRRRVQISHHSTRGRTYHPINPPRRTLHTGADLLTAKQQRCLAQLSRDDRQVEVAHHGSSNGPTETINCRLEHLRGTALGFRNLTHYLARSLLEAGGYTPALHPGL